MPSSSGTLWSSSHEFNPQLVFVSTWTQCTDQKKKRKVRHRQISDIHPWESKLKEKVNENSSLSGFNLYMNSLLVINIQILQLFSCLKWTRQEILSTLRQQRSLATVLPIGTKRVSAWVWVSLWDVEKKRDRKSERGCLSPLTMQHHSEYMDSTGWCRGVHIRITFS